MNKQLWIDLGIRIIKAVATAVIGFLGGMAGASAATLI